MIAKYTNKLHCLKNIRNICNYKNQIYKHWCLCTKRDWKAASFWKNWRFTFVRKCNM